MQSAKGPQGELAKAVSTALETLTSQAELVKKGVQALPAQNMEGKVGRCAICIKTLHSCWGEGGGLETTLLFSLHSSYQAACTLIIMLTAYTSHLVCV